jgi:hypothetical protein
MVKTFHPGWVEALVNAGPLMDYKGGSCLLDSSITRNITHYHSISVGAQRWNVADTVTDRPLYPSLYLPWLQDVPIIAAFICLFSGDTSFYPSVLSDQSDFFLIFHLTCPNLLLLEHVIILSFIISA